MSDRLPSTPAELTEALAAKPLTVWAILKEDQYESSLGDGYYAYLDQVFLRPSGAAAAVEALEADPENGWYRWHIRRYRISGAGGSLRIDPLPSRAEPVTAEDLVSKILSASSAAMEGA